METDYTYIIYETDGGTKTKLTEMLSRKDAECMAKGFALEAESKGEIKVFEVHRRLSDGREYPVFQICGTTYLVERDRGGYLEVMSLLDDKDHGAE